MSSVQVLNTRPRGQSAELTRLLEDAGFRVIEAPAIAIEPAWQPDVLTATRRQLASGRYAWVILASRNAGEAIRDELGPVRVACGAATARALGLTAEVSLERFSAGAAIGALQARVGRGERVLVPRAAEGRDELVDGLRELGVLVDAPVAYRTIPADDAAAQLRAGGVDVVTVCSPSAVSSLVDALTPEVALVCLGATTAEAAINLGLRVDGVASSTTMAALVAEVQRLASSEISA